MTILVTKRDRYNLYNCNNSISIDRKSITERLDHKYVNCNVILMNRKEFRH